ncbi:MAG: ferrous iron transport protein B [Lachnospiraceae bacterium]|nr:ferrous iron transport protein B [Lachnospiraceae bacterium]
MQTNKQIRIALVGNPNSGKTTLFNALTGSNQFVGNWPGVTVEKKEGKLKGREDVIVTDLPGVYSLSPYTPEEVVARNYLVEENPDVVLNIIDGTNLERNLYLTTQVLELGVPVVVAINMMDVVRKNKDSIDTQQLSKALRCPVVEISAQKETGINEAAEAAIAAAGGEAATPLHIFSGATEHALAHIEEATVHDLSDLKQRWYAIKLFERDERVIAKLGLTDQVRAHIEKDIRAAEREMDDDADSIIANERYEYIGEVVKTCYKKKRRGMDSTSDKIDRVVTNRFFALPIFFLVMFLVYFISISTVGAWGTNWANEGLFGEGFYLFGIKGCWIPGIPVLVSDLLDAVNCAGWLRSLIIDGIIAGVGSVLGFVPQMFMLFLFLAFLEACGYMSRIAFVMDRIFRRFGLSGKSFIPMLIGTGCGVPGIMASRTIENDSDRRMTIITTTFIPCGAKLPVIGLIASAMFGGAAWVATSAYFIGVASIVISGIILKKTKRFAGKETPFVMELPAYHLPTLKNLLHSMWERGFAFIKKAGTVILIASIVIWLGSNFGTVDGSFGYHGDAMDLEDSVLGMIARAIAWLFVPIGFGNVRETIATLMGLLAKEEIVGVFGVLEFKGLTQLAAYSFLLFNLLCAPCVAAMGAIRREMNSAKWTWFAIGYQCTFAYAVSFMVYQFGLLFTGHGFTVATAFAFLVFATVLYLFFRPNQTEVKNHASVSGK